MVSVEVVVHSDVRCLEVAVHYFDFVEAVQCSLDFPGRVL